MSSCEKLIEDMRYRDFYNKFPSEWVRNGASAYENTLACGPDVTCSEKVKRIEITALEQYMETGKSGIQNIDQSEEEQNN